MLPVSFRVVLVALVTLSIASCSLSEPPKKRAAEPSSAQPAEASQELTEEGGAVATPVDTEPKRLDKQSLITKRGLRVRPKIPLDKLRGRRGLKAVRPGQLPRLSVQKAGMRPGDPASTTPPTPSAPAEPAAVPAPGEPTPAPAPVAGGAEQPKAEPVGALEPTKEAPVAE